MSEPDRIATIERVTDHVARGLARLTDRWQRPAIRAVLSAWLAEVQELEDAAWQILSLTIDTAEGDALSQYGHLLGLPRRDAAQVADAPYRLSLKAWARAIRASGTDGDLDAVLSYALGGGAYALEEYFPAGLVIVPEEPLAIPDELARKIFAQARSGGIDAQLVSLPAAAAFRFAAGDEVVNSDHGFAEDDQTGGGALAGVV